MYLGLLDEQEREITARGYHRVCINKVRFALAPPESPGFLGTFINLDEVKFPTAQSPWGRVRYYAVFIDADSAYPISRVTLSELKMIPADVTVSFRAGAIRVDISEWSMETTQ